MAVLSVLCTVHTVGRDLAWLYYLCCVQYIRSAGIWPGCSARRVSCQGRVTCHKLAHLITERYALSAKVTFARRRVALHQRVSPLSTSLTAAAAAAAATASLSLSSHDRLHVTKTSGAATRLAYFSHAKLLSVGEAALVMGQLLQLHLPERFSETSSSRSLEKDKEAEGGVAIALAVGESSVSAASVLLPERYTVVLTDGDREQRNKEFLQLKVIYRGAR